MDLRLPRPSLLEKIFLVSPCFNKVITHALFSLVLLLSLFTIIHYTTSFQAFSLFPFSFILPHLSDGGREERCDYAEGSWLDDGGPLYYSEECPFLDPGFQCRRNGRNDTRYLQWRWQPHLCRLLRGNYFQINNTLNISMDIKDAYRMTIQTIKHWAVQNLHPKTNFVFFRSYAQSHYSNGNWDIGGSCYNESEPKTEGEKVRPEPWSNRVMSMVLQDMKDGEKVGFLNITYLTELRADGHPSSHREPGTPFNAPEDCSHWCLPGVPDVWNEILYADLLSMDYGTRTNTS